MDERKDARVNGRKDGWMDGLEGRKNERMKGKMQE